MAACEIRFLTLKTFFVVWTTRWLGAAAHRQIASSSFHFGDKQRPIVQLQSTAVHAARRGGGHARVRDRGQSLARLPAAGVSGAYAVPFVHERDLPPLRATVHRLDESERVGVRQLLLPRLWQVCTKP